MRNFPGLLFITSLLALPMVSACADTNALADKPPAAENTVPRFTYERHLLGMRIDYLHRVNIGDIGGLRAELQDWMVWDCLALWQLIQGNSGTAEERERAYDQLRLVAIQTKNILSKSGRTTQNSWPFSELRSLKTQGTQTRFASITGSGQCGSHEAAPNHAIWTSPLVQREVE